MKKLGIWIIVMALVLSTCIGYAIDLDLSGYTDEQIIELNSLVNQELVNRKIEKHAKIDPGKYLVGVDIPVGTYIFRSADTSEERIFVQVFNNDESMINNNMAAYFRLDAEKTEFRVHLIDGNMLYLDKPIYIYIFTGIVFE